MADRKSEYLFGGAAGTEECSETAEKGMEYLFHSFFSSFGTFCSSRSRQNVFCRTICRTNGLSMQDAEPKEPLRTAEWRKRIYVSDL